MDTRFWLCEHCDVDFGDMTIFKVMTQHPLVMNVCEIFPRSIKEIISCGPDKM